MRRGWFALVAVVASWLSAGAPPACGQQPPPAPAPAPPPPAPSGPLLGPALLPLFGPPPEPAPAPPEFEFAVSDSGVGYIDNPFPGDQLRLRFDPAYDFRRPNRAEFFYPKGAPLGPGLPIPERSVDYQELSVYLEKQFLPRLSGFVEVPARFLNPDLNANAAGFSDLNAGAKFAFLTREEFLASFQFRTYAPTGDGDRGLGTEHVSLEPALLWWKGAGDRLALQGELRYWVPVGGTDFAGDVIRYGLGASYDLLPFGGGMRLAPVAEVVGWTVLGGKESFPGPTGIVSVEDAAGDTIINAKLGVRFGFGERADFYAGYGRALTGERWYADIFRVEARWFY